MVAGSGSHLEVALATPKLNGVAKLLQGYGVVPLWPLLKVFEMVKSLSKSASKVIESFKNF